MKISENAYINGQMHGVVSIKDEHGNVLVRKHNMIVLSGRKTIMDILFSNTTNYLFDKMYLGTGTDLTTSGMSTVSTLISECVFGIPGAYYTGVSVAAVSGSYEYTFTGVSTSTTKTSATATTTVTSSVSVSDDDYVGLLAKNSSVSSQFQYMVSTPSNNMPECHMCAVFKCPSQSSGLTITEMGLISSAYQAGQLFSRVVFDPVYMSSGTTYQIDYHIYF